VIMTSAERLDVMPALESIFCNLSCMAGILEKRKALFTLPGLELR